MAPTRFAQRSEERGLLPPPVGTNQGSPVASEPPHSPASVVTAPTPGPERIRMPGIHRESTR
ncbi:hypothetical protein Kisp02_02260 [Kineosporia sp. NBRC 101731]|nr:hypothetical protein Kisp02_02260 [Kineosporia sp. NBRC 101731]